MLPVEGGKRTGVTARTSTDYTADGSIAVCENTYVLTTTSNRRRLVIEFAAALRERLLRGAHR